MILDYYCVYDYYDRYQVIIAPRLEIINYKKMSYTYKLYLSSSEECVNV